MIKQIIFIGVLIFICYIIYKSTYVNNFKQKIENYNNELNHNNNEIQNRKKFILSRKL